MARVLASIVMLLAYTARLLTSVARLLASGVVLLAYTVRLLTSIARLKKINHLP